MEANKSGIIEYTTAASTTSTISILVRIIVQCLYKMKKNGIKRLKGTFKSPSDLPPMVKNVKLYSFF